MRQSSGALPRSYAVTAVLCVLLAAFSSPSLIGTPVSRLAQAESCCKLTSLPQIGSCARPAAPSAGLRPRLCAVVLHSKSRG